MFGPPGAETESQRTQQQSQQQQQQKGTNVKFSEQGYGQALLGQPPMMYPQQMAQGAAANGAMNFQMTPEQYQQYCLQYQQYMYQCAQYYMSQQQRQQPLSAEVTIDPRRPKEAMRTLYIGNLDGRVTEELLRSICQDLGPIVCIKLIQDKTGQKAGYAFVEFANRSDAEKAFGELDQKKIYDRELILNWSVSQAALDSGKAVRVWCGGLSPDMDDQKVFQMFEPYGNVLDAHVIRDLKTGKSKLYAFITFGDKKCAEAACTALHGTKMGSRTLNVNLNVKQQPSGDHVHHTYESVLGAAGPTHRTVWMGSIGPDVDEPVLTHTLCNFGTIESIRMFHEKACCFVKFQTHESAALCIATMDGEKIAQSTVKCAWGKADQ